MIVGRRSLDALVERLLERIASLEQSVAAQQQAQFAALDARIAGLDGNFTDLAALIRRLDQDLKGGLTHAYERIDAGNAHVAARLDNDFTTLADLTRRLDQDLANGLAQAAERLAADLAHVARSVEGTSAAVAAAAAQLTARLENDLTNLAEFTRRVDRDLTSGLAQAAERVASELGAVAQSVQQAEAAAAGGRARLDNELTALAAFSRRLDQDLVQGLAQLAATVAGIADAVRINSSLVAKLALDQSDPGDRRRDLHRAPAAETGALARLPAVTLPPELHRAIADRGWAEGEVCCLPAMTADALPTLIDTLSAARVSATEPRRLVWAQPPGLAQLLSAEESVQLFGLLGRPAHQRLVAAADGEWRLVLGQSRVETYALCLRWSMPALDEFQVRLKPLFAAALDRFALHGVFHAIDIPDSRDGLDPWKAAVGELAGVLAGTDGAAFGAVLPPDFCDDGLLAWLRNTLREAGATLPLAFQWVRGRVKLAASAEIADFADAHGIAMECTPVPRGAAGGTLEAYDGDAPYRPLRFDLRAPSFGAAHGDLFVMPRRSGREFALAGRARSLGAVLDDAFERSCRRLAPVLDRKGRAQYEAQINRDPSLMALWPEYFVFNWAAPPPARLCLFEFDAAELVAAESPLARMQREHPVQGDPRYVGAARFLDIARRVIAHQGSADRELRAQQVAEHRYLHDLADITADSGCLIDWMPDALGATLELGSGGGAMARRLSAQATRYVGLDLTTDQARALGEYGASGLVGDMHILPFPDSSFDTIIADNVVEHGRDPIAVFAEAHRVLRDAGHAFLVIPHDYASAQFQNAAHLWKADAASVRLAIAAAGFTILRHETIVLGELGVPGAFPSSNGSTGLWHLQKPKSAED